MDLIDKLKRIGERFTKLQNQVQTEEATKNAFVMPFISALGYDVFNPLEVVPEYVADVGIKRGEKVDYCIMKDENPIIIIECKHWKEKLDTHKTQLHRYFHVTNGRFAILTNGVDYRFYSDLEANNKMDEKPFLEFNLTKITEGVAHELKRFQSENFDAEEIISIASDLKYSKEIKEILSSELKNPSDDFVRYFASKVYQGRITSKVLEQFTSLVKRSTKNLINELINERLQIAIQNQEDIEVPQSKASNPTAEETIVNSQSEQISEPQETIAQIEKVKKGVVTTEEELKGFRIVQAILAGHIDVSRVAHRDTKSYFRILFDNNNRKPICRLWLNRSIKYIEVFDANKKGEKIAIEEVEDIYGLKDKVIQSAKNYN